MTSFVTGRTQQVFCDGLLSLMRPAQLEVPQRSVLGLLLFVLYTTDVNQVIAKHRLQLHQYADDCQVSVTTSVDDVVPSAIVVCQCRRHCTRPRCGDRRQINDV